MCWRDFDDQTESEDANTADDHREDVVRTFCLLIILGTLAMPVAVRAESLQITGAAGFAGEWELSATLTEKTSGRAREYAGPLTMTHVGLCTQDGPEQKTGEMHVQMSAWSSRVTATLSAPGLECTYSGKMSETVGGAMTCADHQMIPLKLSVK